MFQGSPEQSWDPALHRCSQEWVTASDLNLQQILAWRVSVEAVAARWKRGQGETEPGCRLDPLLWCAPRTTQGPKTDNHETITASSAQPWLYVCLFLSLTLFISLDSRCSFSRSSLMWRLERKTRCASWWICRCWLSLSVSEITSLRDEKWFHAKVFS